MGKTTHYVPYRFNDMSLADWGRTEIKLVETEMPGLIALRAEYIESKPLKGAYIAGCRNMTIQTAVFIETLVKIGAELQTLRQDQADYIGVKVEGPFEPEKYRY